MSLQLMAMQIVMEIFHGISGQMNAITFIVYFFCERKMSIFTIFI